MEALFKIINSIFSVSDSCLNDINNSLRLEEYDKGAHLLEPPAISAKMYFLMKGLVRGYYYKDGKDITTGFMAENSFVISPVSFFNQVSSYEYLEALENLTLLSIDYAELEYLYRNHLEFNIIGRKITEDYYTNSELRSHNLRLMSAHDRYNWFCDNYKGLANRVSIKHVCTFIGITSETLSRIRAKR